MCVLYHCFCDLKIEWWNTNVVKKTQCQNVSLTTSVYRKNRSKDNKKLQNVHIEKNVQTVFAKTDRIMSKNFIQKFSRINEKHVEKLIEIELIKISNRDSIVIVDVSIELRIIITILQKIDFFAQKRWFHAVRSASMKRNEFEIISISVDSAIQNLK